MHLFFMSCLSCGGVCQVALFTSLAGVWAFSLVSHPERSLYAHFFVKEPLTWKMGLLLSLHIFLLLWSSRCLLVFYFRCQYMTVQRFRMKDVKLLVINLLRMPLTVYYVNIASANDEIGYFWWFVTVCCAVNARAKWMNEWVYMKIICIVNPFC